MRILLAGFFIVNFTCVVWLRMLPQDYVFSECALAQEELKNVGALSMQVEVGRQYERMFKKHNLGNIFTLWVLVVNACLCFLAVVALTARKQIENNNSVTQHGAISD